MVALGGVAVSYERGTPVGIREYLQKLDAARRPPTLHYLPLEPVFGV